MTQFTDNLGFSLQEDNENPDTWGQVLNSGVISLLEEALVGDSSASVVDVTASTDIILTIQDGTPSDPSPTGVNKARCGILTFTGSLSNPIEVTLPTRQGWYVVDCTDLGLIEDITFKTSNSTNTVTLSPGSTAFFFTTPTDLFPLIQTGGGGGASLLAINNLSDLSNDQQAVLNLGDALYPVGSIFMNTVNTNPQTFFGGTWQALAPGRVLLGAGTTTDDRGETPVPFTGGDTGGEFNHVLTISELASHTHGVGIKNVGTGSGNTYVSAGNLAATPDNLITSEPTGSSAPHNNLQPYLTVYMWERTS